MNINDLKQSKYLKGSDFPEPRNLTIKSVETVNVAKDGDPKEIKPIVTFKEMEKGMVFNQTNLKRCAKALDSDETDDWIGKKICVYWDEDIEFGGEIVGGLRVRRAQAAAPKPAPADEVF